MSVKTGLIEGAFKLMRPKWTRLWVLRRWWWQAVAPGLMSENRDWQRMYESLEEENNKLEDRVDELKEERYKQDTFYTYIQEGYWRVTPTSAYRIDKKFIEWYSTWIAPVQMELELEHKGLLTGEELPLDRKAV